MDSLQKTLDEAIALSERTMDHCESAIRNSHYSEGVDWVPLMLLSRMLELQRAMHSLVVNFAAAPAAIIILARAQYEVFLNLRFMLDPVNAKDREDLAKRYLEFGEYEYIQFLGADKAAHRATLSAADQSVFDRREKVAIDYANRLGGKKQKSWNGLTIKDTAESIGFLDNHVRWYPVMCGVAHGNPSMAHKSFTFGPDGVMLCQPDEGRKDSAEWLDRGAGVLFAITEHFQNRRRDYPDSVHQETRRRVLGK